MLVLRAVLLALLQPLLLQAARATTVCTVTINSPHEKTALQAAFPDARFVELVDYAPAESPRGADWLSRACRAGIQCDVLLVSGHFANRFFGDTPFDLPIRTLEQRSCEAVCDGVIKRPKFVFLFGCNTLASKRPDHRSQAEYRSILIRDGLDADRADRVVALRYAPLGDATKARIQKVFSRDALVFGFSSTSPLGEDAGPRFRRYLHESRPPILKALQDRPADQKTRNALVRSWMAAFRGTNPEFIEGGPALTATECRFRDVRIPRLERLLSAERLLEDAPVQNALLVHDFLSGESNWSEEEHVVLSRMMHNEAGRRQVLDILPDLRDSKDVYFSMLGLAHRLGWLDQLELERLQSERLRAMLIDGVAADELDFLCSRDLSYVPTADVLARNRHSLPFIRALSCLGARDLGVRGFLERRLSDGSRDARLAALDALRELQLFDPSDVGRLRDMYRNASGELKERLLWALAASNGASAEVQRFIGAAALDPDTDVAWTSGQVLKQLQSTDVETLRALAAALSRRNGFVRRGVALAFESLAPRNAQVLELLYPFRADGDPVVRQAIAHVLTFGSGQTEASSQTSPGNSVTPAALENSARQ
jgi:hypothetical protein